MKVHNWYDILVNHWIFSDFSEEEIEYLLLDSFSSELEVQKGEIVAREGEKARAVFVVGSGLLDAVRKPDKGRRTYSIRLKRGDSFGETEVLEHRVYDATVSAKEDSLLLEVSGEAFLGILSRHPEAELKLLLKVSDTLEGSF
ncbi:MAG: cyclic nucleotide-binding domain-containing protein [Candidatus Methanosuratincola sp.]